MSVVERPAPFGMSTQLGVVWVSEFSEPASDFFRDFRVDASAVTEVETDVEHFVGVRDVGESWKQNRNRGPVAGFRTDYEREVIGIVSGPELHRINTACDIAWQFKADGRRPSGILEVVIVEVSGRVLVRRLLEVDLMTVPAVTCYRAQRRVDELGMEAVARYIGQCRTPLVNGKIPHDAEISVVRELTLRHESESLHLLATQCSSKDGWPFDLAVEEPERISRPPFFPCGDHDRRVRCGRTQRRQLMAPISELAAPVDASHERLPQCDNTIVHVVARGDEVPVLR